MFAVTVYAQSTVLINLPFERQVLAALGAPLSGEALGQRHTQKGCLHEHVLYEQKADDEGTRSYNRKVKADGPGHFHQKIGDGHDNRLVQDAKRVHHPICQL